MRITNTQAIEVEKIVNDSSLDLDLFTSVRGEKTIWISFNSDCFVFEIFKKEEFKYSAKYTSVDNISKQTSDSEWHTILILFQIWVKEIKNEVENDREIFLPSKKVIPASSMSNVIKKISPKFDLIFNQAFEAEQLGLNEICGLGYRKAFEFLIKDYVMRGMTKDQQWEIKNMGITQVVKNHISDPGIQLILHRILWLGNDHAHYLPVFKSKTINDLKQLIYTTVSWIEANEQLLKINQHALKIEKSMPFKSRKKP